MVHPVAIVVIAASVAGLAVAAASALSAAVKAVGDGRGAQQYGAPASGAGGQQSASPKDPRRDRNGDGARQWYTNGRSDGGEVRSRS